MDDGIRSHGRGVVKRSFERSGKQLVDVYDTNAAGRSVSFQTSADALTDLRWTRVANLVGQAPQASELQHRRRALLERLRSAPVAELDNADFIEVKRLGDPEVAAALGRRFAELVTARASGDVATVACAASAILAFDRTNVEAAELLVGGLLSDAASIHERTLIVGFMSDAWRDDVESEAMVALRDSLSSLIDGRRGLVWGAFAYVGVAPLLKIERAEMLERCRVELREQSDGWSRLQLINELAEVPGSDVLAMLLDHLGVEPLLRLRVRLVGCLGDLLAEARRSEILEEGLGSDSPSCRFLAVKLLRRVPQERRRILATTALQSEPDAALRALLDQAIEHAES